MNKHKTSHSYLFKLPSNIFNNEEPSYEINPFPNSDQNKVLVFGGNNDQMVGQSIVYVYLELSKELNDSNRFINLQRLLNLVYMETGLPTYILPVQIDKNDSIKDLLAKYASMSFCSPRISYSGTAPKHNHIARVKACTDLMIGLSNGNFRRFDNAINTYVWALELMELPNPHLKYTLYMTLFLSSIEQLIDDPSTCKHKPIPQCEGCGKKFAGHHPEGKGRSKATEAFIREMLTGNGVNDAVVRVDRLYQKLRSSFLHNGTLSGREKVGGFLSDKVDDNRLIVEDMMNTLILNRQLLEQFLVRRQSK